MRYRILRFGFMLMLGPLIGTATAMEPATTEDGGEQSCQSSGCDVIANMLMGIGQPFYDALQLDFDMRSQGAPQGTTARRNVAATATTHHPDWVEPPTRVELSAEASNPPAPWLVTLDALMPAGRCLMPVGPGTFRTTC